MGERYTTLLRRAEFLTPSEPVTCKGGSDVLVVTSDNKTSIGEAQRLSRWTIAKEPGFDSSLSVITAIF